MTPSRSRLSEAEDLAPQPETKAPDHRLPIPPPALEGEKLKKQRARRKKKDVVAIDRAIEALALRKAGATYHQIAEQLGYANPSVARKAALVTLERAMVEVAHEYVELELSRLDSLYLKVYEKGLNGDLKSIDMCVKISMARAKLYGADRPVVIPGGGRTSAPALGPGEDRSNLPQGAYSDWSDASDLQPAVDIIEAEFRDVPNGE